MFDIGAGVDFPNGRGTTLRYRNWTGDADDDRFGGDISIAAEITIAFVTRSSHKPTQMQIDFPLGAQSELPPGSTSQIRILWKLGDQIVDNIPIIV